MFLVPLLRGDRRQWCLRNLDTGSLLAARVESAFDSTTRRRGLLGRHSLDGSALVLAPCALVHTFFMRFAIDVVLVDREGVVVAIHHQVGPWRIAGSWRAFATIELDGGQARRTGLGPGHRLAVQPLDADYSQSPA